MGEKSLATATPSMQCKRRAGDVDKEGGNEGDVRAGKRAAVDVRQELPEVNLNEIKTSSKWILKEGNLFRMEEISFKDLNLRAASVRMFEDAKEGGELTDMEFVLDSGKRIRGHKVWLMARCDYIRAMLSSGMREEKTGIVPVREFSDGCFMALLEYIYTGSVGRMCLGQDWGEMWEVAHLFGMSAMVVSLLSGVTLDTVEEAALFAVERGNVKLMERCVDQLTFPLNNFYLGFKDSDARSTIRTMELLVKNREATSWKPTRDGIRAILEAMKKLKDDAPMLERACATLAAVTGWRDVGEVNHLDVEKLGGIKCIVQALDNHRDHDGVQEHGWRAIENCGCGPVLAAMNASYNRDNEWVQLHCCKALHRLANLGQVPLQGQESGAGGEASDGTVTDIKGMVCTVIESIRPKENGINPHCSDVKQGLQALRNFGVGAVVVAMNTYPNNAWVQEHCCQTMAGLLKDSVDEKNAAIRALVWKGGGLEAVLSAMKSHRGSARVQAKACKAISFMEETMSVGERQGVVAKRDQMFCAIMEAVETHKGSSPVLVNALPVLISFCYGSVERRTRVVKVALEAMEAHENLKLLVAACSVLESLCEDKAQCEVRRFVVEAGGVEAVVRALSESCFFKDGHLLQLHSCGALGILCTNAHARNRAGSCGGVEAVVLRVLDRDIEADSENSEDSEEYREDAHDAAGKALVRLCAGYKKDAGNRALAWAAVAHWGGNIAAKTREWFEDRIDGDGDGYSSGDDYEW